MTLQPTTEGSVSEGADDAGHEPVVETQDLTRRFDRVTAVDQLTFSVARGEIFGLIGPDGAGKTTTLRMLAAVMRPTSGVAHVLGYDTRSQAERLRRRLGYMAQKFSLYRDLTVWENLSFFADAYGVRGSERAGRLTMLLAFARLEEFRNRRASALSGGMQKKLALACSLVHRPEIVMLDEPTTGVDPISRREFWDILTGLHVEGVTIVVSTPYMDEAERCSRVGLLYDGRLIQCATPEAIRQMTPGELLAVWTPQTLRARDLAIGLPGVLSAKAYGDVLHVFVENADVSALTLRQGMEECGIPVLDIRRATPNVEDAFITLIERQRSAWPLQGSRTLQPSSRTG